MACQSCKPHIQTLEAAVELQELGMSIRGISRVLESSRRNVARLLKIAQDPALEAQLRAGVGPSRLVP